MNQEQENHEADESPVADPVPGTRGPGVEPDAGGVEGEFGVFDAQHQERRPQQIEELRLFAKEVMPHFKA